MEDETPWVLPFGFFICFMAVMRVTNYGASMPELLGAYLPSAIVFTFVVWLVLAHRKRIRHGG